MPGNISDALYVREVPEDICPEIPADALRANRLERAKLAGCKGFEAER